MREFRPYPHQLAGVNWIIERPACALFWGMGSGKTVATLTAIDLLLHDYIEPGPVLVVAPLRVALDTWTTEARTWAHLQQLRVVSLCGPLEQRTAALQQPGDVYVINRELLQWLDEAVPVWPWRILVIDELSSFKSQQAKRWRVLRRRRAGFSRVIGLTGTPRPNGIEDLWPELYLLDGGQRLGRTIGQFRARYLVPEKSNGYIVYRYKPRDGAEAEVYDRVADICMSIKKADVIDLPPQLYHDVVIDTPPDLLRRYRRFEREQVLQALDDGGEIVAASAAALTNKLLQFANGAIYDADGAAHELHSLKLDALSELLEGAGGDNVLVLYSYKSDAARIRARVPEVRQLNTAQDIADWQAGKIHVAMAHPASIGHGLNLQSGGHLLVWFGLSWSLELYQQANERLHRPGQLEVCHVYHIMLRGTHDERVLAALQDKDRGQAAAIERLKLEVLNNG